MHPLNNEEKEEEEDTAILELSRIQYHLHPGTINPNALFCIVYSCELQVLLARRLRRGRICHAHFLDSFSLSLIELLDDFKTC